MGKVADMAMRKPTKVCGICKRRRQVARRVLLEVSKNSFAPVPGMCWEMPVCAECAHRHLSPNGHVAAATGVRGACWCVWNAGVVGAGMPEAR